jgi:hypothetical protein
MRTRTASRDRSDDYERRLFLKEVREAEEGSLAERRESCQEFFEAMRDNPEIIGERVSWLLDGTMGYGGRLVAREVLARPRSNRVAWFTQIIAALEFKCPQRMAVASWKRLSPREKETLLRHVERAMSRAMAEGTNGTSGDRARRRSRSRSSGSRSGRDRSERPYPNLNDRYPGYNARTRPRSSSRSSRSRSR